MFLPETSYEENAARLKKISIEELPFPQATLELFKKKRIETADDLAGLLRDERLRSVSRLSKKACQEIRAGFELWLERLPALQEKEDKASLAVFTTLASRLASLEPVLASQLEAEYRAQWPEGPFELDRVAARLLALPCLQGLHHPLEKRIDPQLGLAKEEGLAWLEEKGLPASAANTLWESVSTDPYWWHDGTTIYLKKPTLAEQIEALPPSLSRTVFEQRLQGLTLGAIAEKHRFTKQAVHQKVHRILDGLHPAEDYLLPLFARFAISRDEFARIFPALDPSVYVYLSLRTHGQRPKLSPEAVAAYDGPIHERLRPHLEPAAQINTHMNSLEIAVYILKQHPGQSFTLEELTEKEHAFVREHHLPESRQVSQRSLGSQLRQCEGVVFDFDRRARWLDIKDADLWQEIDFSRYEGRVISAQLILRDYAARMEELDIREGNELYCVLKNARARTDSPWKERIRFERNPILDIDDGDEQEQVLALMRSLAPVSASTLAAAYEELYGVRAESVIGNYLGPLRPYLHGDQYTLDLPVPEPSIMKPLCELLKTRSWWSLSGLQKACQEAGLQVSEEELNRTSLYEAGYLVNTNYCYSREYPTIRACLLETVFARDEVQLDALDSDLVRTNSFRALSNDVRRELRFVETKPGVFTAFDKLASQYGITSAQVRAFQKRLRKSQADTPYWNSTSIKEALKNDPLAARVNDPWLLDQFLKYSGARYFELKDGPILVREGLVASLAGLAAWLISEADVKNLDELPALCEARFGARVPAFKFRSALARSPWHDELVRLGLLAE